MFEKKQYELFDNGLAFEFINEEEEVPSEINSPIKVEQPIHKSFTIEANHPIPIEHLSTEYANHLGKRVVVIGIGGGGCNAIDYLQNNQFNDVSLVKIDSNIASLNSHSSSVINIPLSQDGNGTGGSVDKGTTWVQEREDNIREILEPANLIVLVSSLGGGTGTGATQAIAELARKLNKLTIAVVNTPSAWEVHKKHKAMQMIDHIKKERLVDSLMIISNDCLEQLPKSLDESYIAARLELLDILIGINTLLNPSTNTKIDFNDLQSALVFGGQAMFGCAEVEGKGLEQLQDAFEQAKSHSLLDTCDFTTARGLLVNLKMPRSPSNEQVRWLGQEIARIVIAEDSVIKFNWTVDEDIEENRLLLTYIATDTGGFSVSNVEKDAKTTTEDASLTITKEVPKTTNNLKHSNVTSLANERQNQFSNSFKPIDPKELQVPAFLKKQRN